MQINIQQLDEDKTNSYVQEVLSTDQAQLLINHLKQNHVQIANPIDVKAANLILNYEDQENVLIDVVFIYFDNEAVIEATRLSNSNKLHKIVAHTAIERNNIKMIKQIEIVEGKLQVVNEVDYKSSYFNFIDGDFEEFSADKVGKQAWYEGCLVFGDSRTGKRYTYKHCGAKCGDNGNSGGGTPINSLDTCCRAHDRCWEVFGKNDCECDKQLGICAEKTVDPGWYMVATWAYKKSCK